MMSVFVTTGALGCAVASCGATVRTANARAVIRMTPPGLVADAELLQRLLGVAIPSCDGAIAEVLQILDAHLRRPEAARSEIAEAIEERDAVRMFELRLDGPRDVVEHGRPLRLGAIDKGLVVPLLALD